MGKPNVIYQQNKKSGVIYAYENRSYWDPVKKQSRANRKLLGKIDPQTGTIVPTRSRNSKADAAGQTTEEVADQVTEKSGPLFDVEQIIGKVFIFLRLFVCETIAKRIMGMVLIAAGLPDSRVAELIGLCDKSVITLKKGLENGALDSMFHIAGGGRKRKLADVEGSIVEEINNGAFHTHQQIADMIQEKYGVKVSLPVIGRLLKKTASGG
jgi:transposase